MRLLRLVAWLAVLALPASSVLVTASSRPASADEDPSVSGQWSTPFDLQVIGIHATVLPGGKVLLFHRPELSAGSDARVWDPVTGDLTDVSFTTERDIFCAGQTVLGDGRVLVTGGHVHDGTSGLGVRDTDLFDPLTGSWAAGPLMNRARWYPTNIELGDGTVLIFGGTSKQGVYVQTVERFDPIAGTMSPLPGTANKRVYSYPRMHLLPSGQIAKVGEAATTLLFDPASETWSTAGSMLYGKRTYGTSVLLPGLSSILALGGSNGSVATNTAEVLDLSTPTPQWQYTGSLALPRRHANAVLLPDGKVLAVGGGATSYYGHPTYQVERYDPATGQWSSMAAQQAPRMYHSTAVLLPDGRVLSTGQDKSSSYSYTGEIYSPPYLFAGDRPVIDQADSSVLYGGELSIDTSDPGGVSRVALVRPATATHSVDFDQRFVDLTWTVDGESHITASIPSSGNEVPPGWYMLFVVNGNGVPSVASWVHVGAELVSPLPRDAMAGAGRGSGASWSRSGYPVGLPNAHARLSDRAVVVTGSEDSSSPSRPDFRFFCSRRRLKELRSSSVR